MIHVPSVAHLPMRLRVWFQLAGPPPTIKIKGHCRQSLRKSLQLAEMHPARTAQDAAQTAHDATQTAQAAHRVVELRKAASVCTSRNDAPVLSTSQFDEAPRKRQMVNDSDLTSPAKVLKEPSEVNEMFTPLSTQQPCPTTLAHDTAQKPTCKAPDHSTMEVDTSSEFEEIAEWVSSPLPSSQAPAPPARDTPEQVANTFFVSDPNEYSLYAEIKSNTNKRRRNTFIERTRYEH